ncbi:NfeD family protein [Acinetobacter apis]|uniref:NfeD-like C-terminal domain-containing protein n=1 Tax=Acinetobacter apis TaxID=1229165 RepID=A0A217ECG5_9GAMM|nr:NfeD family protein [Acinetobacter apis]SNQ28198.1 hypothetical protein SAMN05444584_0110 [Acinetobacter apis]
MDMLLEPWHWFVLGIVLILFELFLTTFAVLWFGIAAVMVSILVWIYPDMSTTLQVISWTLLSILCTFLWFKFIKPLSKDKITNHLSRESVIGQVGLVIQLQIDNNIQVRFPMPLLGSDEWFCRCSQNVHVGDKVKVIDISGNILVVEPYPL